MNWLLKLDQTGKPVCEVETIPEDGSPVVVVPDAISEDDLMFAKFNFEKKKFELEERHFVSVDRQTGAVIGDVVTNRPVRSKKYLVIDVTERTKNLPKKIGCMNGQVFSRREMQDAEALVLPVRGKERK